MGANPLALPLLLTVGSYCYAVAKWGSISSSVPILWYPDASPLLWVPKWLAVIFLPLLQLLIPYAIYLSISQDSEVDKQAGESKHAVAQLIVLPSVFLAFLYNFILLPSAFVSEDHYFSPRFFAACIALWLLIWLGYLIQYVEPNRSIGIVTPWTLENHTIWQETHTLAGYVLQLSGLVLFFFAIVLPAGWFLLVITLFLWLGAYGSVVGYSYYLSKEAGREPLLPQSVQ